MKKIQDIATAIMMHQLEAQLDLQMTICKVPLQSPRCLKKGQQCFI